MEVQERPVRLWAVGQDEGRQQDVVWAGKGEGKGGSDRAGDRGD